MFYLIFWTAKGLGYLFFSFFSPQNGLLRTYLNVFYDPFSLGVYDAHCPLAVQTGEAFVFPSVTAHGCMDKSVGPGVGGDGAAELQGLKAQVRERQKKSSDCLSGESFCLV